MSGTTPASTCRHTWPSESLTAEERNAWDQLDFFYKKGSAYANEMSLRPQTLYAIADSPVKPDEGPIQANGATWRTSDVN